MNNLIKTSVFLFAFFLSIFSAKATHILGGEIEWECEPNGQYIFSLTLYSDCNSGSIINTTQTILSNGNPGSITCTFTSLTPVMNACEALPCDPNTGAYLGGIEKYEYRSQPVTLTGNHPATGRYFYWQGCCRPLYADNLQSPSAQGFTLRAVMYNYSPTGSTNALSANPCYDSSPKFMEEPDVKFCSGLESSYLPFGFDVDLDSLHYDWAKPLEENGTVGNWLEVNWKNTNFSYTSPLPNASQNPNNIPATLHNETGIIHFKTYSANSNGDAYATCVKVSEYRNGQLIGEVFRDIPLFVKPCTPAAGGCSASPKNYPTDLLTWSQPQNALTKMSPANQVSLSHYVRNNAALPGDTIAFNLLATDYDLTANCNLELITIKAFGTQMSTDSIYSANGPNKGVGPSASLTSLNPNGSFSTTLSNSVSFQWVPNCQLADSESARFYFLLENNNCPLPTKKWVIVDVPLNIKTYGDIPVFDTTNSVLNTNGDIDLFWHTPDTSNQFSGYVLWHSFAGGLPYILHQAPNFNDTSYTHVSPPSGQNLYWIRAVGGCINGADTVKVNSNNSGVISFKTNIGIEEATLQVGVYPQPMGNDVTFEGLRFNDDVKVKVYSATGALLLNQTIAVDNGKAKLNVKALKSGVYVFDVYQRGKTARLKLVKQ